jgi:zinc/manganese transport system substrate-binding protein
MRVSTVFSIVALAVIAICGPAAARTLNVVATFTILADMTQRVGGDLVAITTLVGPDGDVHVFEPTPADARAIAGADLVVVNGLGFEPWLDRLVKASGFKGRIIVAADGVAPRNEVEHGHAHMDPHAWQNIANGRRYVVNIAAGLAAADPQGADAFAANARAYDAELAGLDGWVRGEIAGVLEPQRKIITSHDAFEYFGAAYGIEFLAPAGISTEAEPKPADIAALVRQIKDSGIKAVFFENMSDPRLLRTLSRDAGAVVGGTLYVDSLSVASGPAPSYIAMFRHNVPMLRDAMMKSRASP